MTKTQMLAIRRARGAARGGWIAAGLMLGTACGDDDTKHPEADDSGTEAANATDSGTAAKIDGGTAASAMDAAATLPAHEGGHVITAEGGTASQHACSEPYPKDPRDDTMTGALVRVVTGDNGTPNDPSDDPYDLLLPQEMLDWLKEQNWIQEHGDWHNVRRWDQGCQRSAPGMPCQSVEGMIARGLSRASLQEGDPGDGYAFLIMHRHMIRGFQQAFPKHVELIRGFYRVPTSKDDPENPVPWVDVRWSDEQLEIIAWMENVTQHLDAFTSEDDYAKWVQFGDGLSLGGGGFGFPAGLPEGGFPGGFVFGDGGFPAFPGGGFPGLGTLDGGVAANPSGGATATGDGGTSNRPGGGIHGGLHSQWTIPGSPYSLVDNNKNVQNFAFWRLHVWLDDMWERYRRARGIGEDDADYQQALIDQCEEMHELGKALPLESQDAGVSGSDAGSSAAETGRFATQVAPILNQYCGGSVCHGADSPTLGLALAGAQPSTVRAGLVGEQASEAAMALVEPGKPEQSWIYRKLTGNFEGIDCATSRCTTMPPAGAAPSAQEIERIRAWIADGASGE